MTLRTRTKETQPKEIEDAVMCHYRTFRCEPTFILLTLEPVFGRLISLMSEVTLGAEAEGESEASSVFAGSEAGAEGYDKKY